MKQLRIASICIVSLMCAMSAIAGDNGFTQLQKDDDNTENRTGLWFSPDLGRPEDVLPLKTRTWATKESVTDGVALKCVFEKGSKALLAFEYPGYPENTAGLTFFAKASKKLKVKVNNAVVEVGTEWAKKDIPLADLGEITWRGILLGAAEPITEKTVLIVDRIGFEGPSFNDKPTINIQAGPDQSISSKDILYGAENLAKVQANLKAKKNFRIIAIGDSVTEGAQIYRSSPNVNGPVSLPFHYFARLATLLEENYDYKGITPIQHGKGRTGVLDALPVVEGPVAGEAQPGDLIILEYGANDMGGRGESPEKWKENLKTVIGKIRTATKTDQILVMSPTTGGDIPAKAEGITKALKQLCAEEKVAGADITRLSMYRGEAYSWTLLANQFHPNLMGHIMIAEMIAPILTGKDRSYPE